MAIEINGDCDPRFEAVREVFARNFAEQDEVGGAVAVTLDGVPVVDFWGGIAIREPEQPWERDTIVAVWSTTKGMVALCAHMLADRGLLDYDAPVSRYWPEFAQHGKAAISVRSVLSHQSGVAGVDRKLDEGDTRDWGRMIEAIEESAPLWEPGTKNGYHAYTFGWIVGELVRRISGAPSLGAFFRDEVARPLGVDFFIGTPASEDHRMAEIIQPPPVSVQDAGESSEAPPPFRRQALIFGTSRNAGAVNSREWRAAEIPGANGHANARAVARIYGALARGGEVDGVRLLSRERIELARTVQIDAYDEVLGIRTRRSLGFMHAIPGSGDQRGPEAFGHNGAGGSMGFADPAHRIGFGYVMSRMSGVGGDASDPRGQSLAGAVYRSLGV